MNLPLFFCQNHGFSVLIDSISEHHITGVFRANNLDFDIHHSFSGLIYKLNSDIYNFTFSLEWTHTNVPSYTIFTGTLHIDNKNNKNMLNLKWLLITEMGESMLSGSSDLFEKPKSSNTLKKHPFPSSNTHKMYS